jgi:hypothetical protein
MVTKEVQDQAARLGLSAWVVHAIGVGEGGREKMLELKCVGFSSAGFALAEGESWSEVFDQAARIIFGA